MDAPIEIDPEPYAAIFQQDGYYVCEDVISTVEVGRLRDSIASIRHGEEVRKKRGVYGVRNLLEICDDVRKLAADPRIRQFVSPILGDHAFAVRAIFFDKVPDANWSLYWHQDSVIAVADQTEVKGFVGWSNKAGVWQVQPPAEVLAKMVAVRVHLDDSGTENGPLRVIPGSHRSGWLDDELDQWKARGTEVECLVGAGGVVSMCPLTLHASSAAELASHRRVIHLEYAAEELPAGLSWNNRIGITQSTA